MGYNINFLPLEISLPQFDIDQKQLKRNTILDYNHFTILFSEDRKQPIYCAVNIDGGHFVQFNRSLDKWKTDDRITKENQLTNDFYKLTNAEFHKGHIVRRLDPCWGDSKIAKKSEEDTFHYTNASPQHRNFNPRIWLELERCVLEKGAVNQNQKITVFSGPVLSEMDKPFIEDESVLIPSHFWKIIVWSKSNSKLAAVGFIQSQRDLIWNLVNQGAPFREDNEEFTYFENLEFKNNAVYQVSINLIERLTGLSFDFVKVYLPEVENEQMELKVKEDFEAAYEDGRYRSDGDDKGYFDIEGLILE